MGVGYGMTGRADYSIQSGDRGSRWARLHGGVGHGPGSSLKARRLCRGELGAESEELGRKSTGMRVLEVCASGNSAKGILSAILRIDRTLWLPPESARLAEQTMDFTMGFAGQQGFRHGPLATQQRQCKLNGTAGKRRVGSS